MDIIKFKNKLKKVAKIGDITTSVIQKVQNINNFTELKNDLELLLYVCTIIENEIKQNKTKSISKKDIVIDILNQLFNISDDEKELFGKHIEFLHSNNLIKKVTDYEKIGRSVFNWVNKKLL